MTKIRKSSKNNSRKFLRSLMMRGLSCLRSSTRKKFFRESQESFEARDALLMISSE